MAFKSILLWLSAIALSFSANATLINNGDSTIDTGTGLEWLDLTLTQEQSYNSIVGGFGGYANQGYVHATLDQLCGLWGNAGADTPRCRSEFNVGTEHISQGSYDLLTTLLGRTDVNGTWGLFDGGFIESRLTGYGCINGIDPNTCFEMMTGPLTVYRQLKWGIIDRTHGRVGNWLVRVPEPSIAVLMASGLMIFGVARRKNRA